MSFHFHQTVTTKDLLVGDIVRPINGPWWTVGPNKTVAGQDGDFRNGYDTMTVTAVYDNGHADFIRPYFHLRSDGTFSTVGFEQVNNVSPEHVFELLQNIVRLESHRIRK